MKAAFGCRDYSCHRLDCSDSVHRSARCAHTTACVLPCVDHHVNALVACRSLMAAYELFQNGYQDVRVLKGGIGDWQRQERELVQED